MNKGTVTWSQTAEPASLPLRICAPPNRQRPWPYCLDHGCTGEAYGSEPRVWYASRGALFAEHF